MNDNVNDHDKKNNILDNDKDNDKPMPPVGQICNQIKWCHLVAKLLTNAEVIKFVTRLCHFYCHIELPLQHFSWH